MLAVAPSARPETIMKMFKPKPKMLQERRQALFGFVISTRDAKRKPEEAPLNIDWSCRSLNLLKEFLFIAVFSGILTTDIYNVDMLTSSMNVQTQKYGEDGCSEWISIHLKIWLKLLVQLCSDINGSLEQPLIQHYKKLMTSIMLFTTVVLQCGYCDIVCHLNPRRQAKEAEEAPTNIDWL
ncbi:hypothetical protein L596_016781 [Steinernema carpocapsae]|uniref:Uncharacterized protein n=1 Tax=Steinernema carpocapsae TaxID=34508 RepID=A0A4U5NK02_STECR|nr:hypothetical protein L596_016781 [Steinernema carpocapsae]